MTASLDGRLAALVEYWAQGEAEWRSRAECAAAVRRGEVTTNDFYPGRGDSITLARARAVCDRCPVSVECRDFALTGSLHQGIWGGLSERQRRAFARERRSVDPVVKFQEPVVFTEDEIRANLEAFGAFMPSWEAGKQSAEVCEHVVASIERGPVVQMVFSCVLDPRPLLCGECYEEHRFGHDRMSCVVCGADTPDELARCDVECRSMSVHYVSLDEAVMTPFFVGAIRSYAPLCAAHGGGKWWKLDATINALGLPS